MSELKRCPFCGGNARLTIWTPNAASISCIFCGAHFNVNTKAEAIEAWNTRTERTCRVENSYYDELLDEDYTDLSCGHHVRGAEWEFLFCPDCGAKIERTDDAD